jgi:hypothetical protein
MAVTAMPALSEAEGAVEGLAEVFIKLGQDSLNLLC